MAINDKKKISFVVKKDNEELKLAVQRPNQLHLREAQKVYNATFREAVDSGAIVAGKVAIVVKEQNLWNDDLQAQYDEIQKKIMEARVQLSKGGKVNELKDLAFKIKEYSQELQKLTEPRNSVERSCAESQAKSAQFNKLVSLCTVYDEVGNTKPYFKNYDDLIERQNDPVVGEASTNLMYIYYNIEPSFENKLPENKFLQQWGFVDSKLRRINKDGHLIDDEGRLINEQGRLVDQNGKYIDRNGNPIDDDGNYLTDNQVFLDDDGNPITPPSSPAQSE